MLACLWTDNSVAGSPELRFIDGGLAEVVLLIGERVWTALIELPEQAIALIDWSLQSTLGVSAHDIVNWLGQVFDWDAILATHRTMGQLLNLARRDASDWMRNAAAQAVQDEMAWARAQLSRLPDLDPQTRAWLQRPATSGTGEPPAARAFMGGPDAQWGVQTFGDQCAGSTLGHGGSWATASDIQAVVEAASTSFQPLLDALVAQLSAIDPGTTPLLTLMEDALALIGEGTIDALGALAQKLIPLLADVIDDVWALLAQRIDIPVLTPLYETVIAPGSTASLLDILLLCAAITGELGSRSASGRPLIDPALAAAIANAPSLAALLTQPSGSTAAGTWATDVQLVMTLLSGSAKLLYFMAWVAQRQLPAGAPFDTSLVRGKCALDSAAWAVALAWATTRCAVQTPPSEALKGAAAFLLLDGLISRSKDAVEIVYASRGERVPGQVGLTMAGIETVLGSTVLGCCAVYTSVASALMPRVQPSDESNWNLLLAMPMLQAFGTAVHMGLALPEALNPALPELRVARTIVNGVRSAAPLVSMVALATAARNDWQVPGTIAD